MSGSVTIAVEDSSPYIRILKPTKDDAVNTTTELAGFIGDPSVKHVTVVNQFVNFKAEDSSKGGGEGKVIYGVRSEIVEVENGAFSTTIEIARVNKVTVEAKDFLGRKRVATLLLDGDCLNWNAEKELGFDPLDPDSDSSLTSGNEAGNGVVDGYELFGGLPVKIKLSIGADPLENDTDKDGLTDYFEVVKLGLLTSVNSVDSDGDCLRDGEEDFDADGLTNFEEQNFGSDPLIADTDRDGLSDGVEFNFGSKPLLRDTDGDGLDDDSEYRLGTNPRDPDTDDDGCLTLPISVTPRISQSTILTRV